MGYKYLELSFLCCIYIFSHVLLRLYIITTLIYLLLHLFPTIPSLHISSITSVPLSSIPSPISSLPTSPLLPHYPHLTSIFYIHHLLAYIVEAIELSCLYAEIQSKYRLPPI
jgi:hypothetical protein